MRRSLFLLIAISFLAFPNYSFADSDGKHKKIPGWFVAYETDALGNTIRASLERLVKAVQSGADIKVLTSGGENLRTCNHVALFTVDSTVHVACEVTTQISLVDSVDPIHIRSNPYHTYWWIDTLGNTALARVSIYTGANLGQTTLTDSFGITWFARVR